MSEVEAAFERAGLYGLAARHSALMAQDIDPRQRERWESWERLFLAELEQERLRRESLTMRSRLGAAIRRLLLEGPP